jgi:hypothetical protein
MECRSCSLEDVRPIYIYIHARLRCVVLVVVILIGISPFVVDQQDIYMYNHHSVKYEQSSQLSFQQPNSVS